MRLSRSNLATITTALALAGTSCNMGRPSAPPVQNLPDRPVAAATITTPNYDPFGTEKKRAEFVEKSKIPADVLKPWWEIGGFQSWSGWDPKKKGYSISSDPASLEDPLPSFTILSTVQPRMFEKLPVIPVPFGIEGHASSTNDLTVQGIAKQTNLRMLALSNTGIADPALAEIVQGAGVERLYISHNGITDKGLKPLAGLKNLKSLTIDEGPITDAGVKNLAPLTSLTHLNLSSLRLADQSAQVIAGFTKLTRLRLDSDGLTAAGAKALATLPELRELSIFLRTDDTADAAVGELKGLKKLEWLRLNTSQLTDAGVAHLKQMTQLRYLDAEHARFDPKFNYELKAALPNCTIKFAK